jgi:hypothetical protein
LDFPILEPPCHLRVTQFFLTAAIQSAPRKKPNGEAIGSQESDGSALMRDLIDRSEMPPRGKT